MFIQRKHITSMVVISAIILTVLVAWMVLSQTRFWGLLGYGPTVTISNEATLAPASPPPRRPEWFIKQVSEEISSDPFFLSCSIEKFSACSKIQASLPPISIKGSFQEQAESMLSLAPGNEIVDNCIADSISACSNLAIQKKINTKPSLDACEAYANPTEKQNCKNELYPKIAIYHGDITVCNQVDDEYLQKYCSDTYNIDKAVRDKDITWCSRLSSTERQNECKGTFYVKIAMASDDIKFCAKSQDETQASACSQSFLMKKIESTSLESCKKTYDYTSFVSEKNVLDRIYQNCLSRLAGEILMSIRSDPNLLISKWTIYRQACGALPDMEKKVCLDQLTLVQSGWLVLPPRPDQTPTSNSGTNLNHTWASSRVIAK